jgi:hypothetical protein
MRLILESRSYIVSLSLVFIYFQRTFQKIKEAYETTLLSVYLYIPPTPESPYVATQWLGKHVPATTNTNVGRIVFAVHGILKESRRSLLPRTSCSLSISLSFFDSLYICHYFVFYLSFPFLFIYSFSSLQHKWLLYIPPALKCKNEVHFAQDVIYLSRVSLRFS